MLSNHIGAAQHFCSSIVAHTHETKEPGDLEDSVKVGGTNKQVTEEVEVVEEGGGVTEVPCTHLHPVQLTCIAGNAAAAGNLVIVPARSLPLPTASQPMTITQVSAKTSPTSQPSTTVLCPPTTAY